MYASWSSRFRLKTSASVCRSTRPGEPAAAGAEDDLRLLDEARELRREPLGDDDRGDDVAAAQRRRRPPPRSWGRDRPRSRRGRSPRSRRRSGRRRSPRRGCRRGRRSRRADGRPRSARRGRRAARRAADRGRARRPARASGRGSAGPCRGARRCAVIAPRTPRRSRGRRRGPLSSAATESGEAADLLRVLRREHGRAAVGRDRLDELPDARALRRVERGGRLVEEQHLGLGEERDADVHALLLSRRELTGRAVGRVDGDAREHPLHRRLGIVEPFEPGEEPKVLARGEPPVLRRPLRRPADPRAARAATRRCLRSARARPRGSRGASTSRRRSGPRAPAFRPRGRRGSSARSATCVP